MVSFDVTYGSWCVGGRCLLTEARFHRSPYRMIASLKLKRFRTSPAFGATIVGSGPGG